MQPPVFQPLSAAADRFLNPRVRTQRATGAPSDRTTTAAAYTRIRAQRTKHRATPADADRGHDVTTDTTFNRIVVAGIAGSGKSTVAREIAARLGLRFVEGDSFHPQANIAKMTANEPLTDADRWPWLEAISSELHDSSRIVVSCSSLRRSYRDLLRQAEDVRFIFLDISSDDAAARAAHRVDHFMSAAMIESQIAALELPTPDELDVSVVPADGPVDSVVGLALEALGVP